MEGLKPILLTTIVSVPVLIRHVRSQSLIFITIKFPFYAKLCLFFRMLQEKICKWLWHLTHKDFQVNLIQLKRTGRKNSFDKYKLWLVLIVRIQFFKKIFCIFASHFRSKKLWEIVFTSYWGWRTLDTWSLSPRLAPHSAPAARTPASSQLHSVGASPASILEHQLVRSIGISPLYTPQQLWLCAWIKWKHFWAGGMN